MDLGSVYGMITSRGESHHTAGGPTRGQIEDHILGPYRFTPGTAPGQARADPIRRVTDYDGVRPVGEELPFQLEPTQAGPWMDGTTQEDWKRQREATIRFAIRAHHVTHGAWTIPCEIDAGNVDGTTVIALLSSATFAPQ